MKSNNKPRFHLSGDPGGNIREVLHRLLRHLAKAIASSLRKDDKPNDLKPTNNVILGETTK